MQKVEENQTKMGRMIPEKYEHVMTKVKCLKSKVINSLFL